MNPRKPVSLPRVVLQEPLTKAFNQSWLQATVIDTTYTAIPPSQMLTASNKGQTLPLNFAPRIIPQ